MTDPIKIDTLDIFACVIGLICGMVLLLQTPLGDMLDGNTDAIDFLLAICSATPVVIKRAVLPTPPRRDDIPATIRLGYLLIAIIGALSAGGTAISAWILHRSGETIDPFMLWIGGAGVLMLAVAAQIERSHIRKR